MLAAVSCLLIALVCDRVERIAGPLERPAATHALEGRPILFAATCTLSRRASAISCAPATPTRAAGVSANVVRSPTGTYAEFVPYNLVKAPLGKFAGPLCQEGRHRGISPNSDARRQAACDCAGERSGRRGHPHRRGQPRL